MYQGHSADGWLSLTIERVQLRAHFSRFADSPPFKVSRETETKFRREIDGIFVVKKRNFM